MPGSPSLPSYALSKQPPQKRRKLLGTPGLSSHHRFPLHPWSPAPSAQAVPFAKPETTKSVVSTVTRCDCCQRAIHSISGSAVTCARCELTTCAICSRTCEGGPSLPQPPTAMSSQLLARPSRPVRRLPLNATVMNSTSDTISMPGTEIRRKHELDGGLSEGSNENAIEQDMLPGCGRIICRNCCTESAYSHLNICYGCVEAANQKSADPERDYPVLCL